MIHNIKALQQWDPSIRHCCKNSLSILEFDLWSSLVVWSSGRLPFDPSPLLIPIVAIYSIFHFLPEKGNLSLCHSFLLPFLFSSCPDYFLIRSVACPFVFQFLLKNHFLMAISSMFSVVIKGKVFAIVEQSWLDVTSQDSRSQLRTHHQMFRVWSDKFPLNYFFSFKISD